MSGRVDKIERCPYCHVKGDGLDMIKLDGASCVMCVNCGAMGPVHTDERRAVDDWNKVSKLVEAIKVGVF